MRRWAQGARQYRDMGCGYAEVEGVVFKRAWRGNSQQRATAASRKRTHPAEQEAPSFRRRVKQPGSAARSNQRRVRAGQEYAAPKGSVEG